MFDEEFLICAPIVPMTKAAYLLRFRSDDVDVVRLSPSLGPHA
ncbi:MAG TPA: hypothetical protein VLA09_05200 [Longimicrobiales bacterium]|nr:hypothetical protein [Longimicrobiales bacterium]